MKVITIYQPWATLAALGEKRLETRSRRLAVGLNGKRVAIHAARRPLPRELLRADPEREASVWAAARWLLESHLGDAWHELPLGAVIATARLQDDGPTEELLTPDGRLRYDVLAGEDELRLGDFSAGRWAWRLTDVIRLQPEDAITVSGRQGFWDLPCASERRLRAATGRGIRP